jgi:hypothetical protein
MIVQNKNRGSIGIPVKGFEVSLFIDLPPGYTEVADENWKGARDYVSDKIAAGILVEEFKKVDKAEASQYAFAIESDDARETAKVRVPARLKDCDRKGNRVFEIVRNTYDLKCLDAWLNGSDPEGRQDVRLEIEKQVKGINDGSIKG